MPERSSKIKGPRDLNQLAVGIVYTATNDGLEPDDGSNPEKNPHVAALGRLGGQMGGSARTLKLSAERRREIAQRAANVHWHSHRETGEVIDE